MSAFVDETSITYAPKYLGPPLLDGGAAIKITDEDRVMPSGRRIVHVDYPTITTITEDGEFLLLGYHEPPSTDLSLGLFQTKFPSTPTMPSIDYVPINSQKQIDNENHKSTNSGVHSLNDESLAIMLFHIYEKYPNSFYLSVITIIFLIITTVWLCGRQSAVAMIQQNEARSAQTSRNSNNPRGWFNAKSDDVPNGWFAVGKVHYNPQQILGRGCEGTVVYKGKFDSRDVAVKRVVSEFIRSVDREVDHLRESDTHPHVIRYFCKESDSQFWYLALELCIASLNDYVEQKAVRQQIDVPVKELLRQASDGLAHLHSINIVHRDMKPQNVLLSVANSKGQVRAVISDFGLCKRVRPGRNSLSQRSGMAGTDGWIAPEALFEKSTSYPVDVFSLGCIFYYVLSGGSHPFGDAFQRQMNIMNGKAIFKHLEEDKSNHEAISLISQMIHLDASSRPSAQSVLLHPMFWSSDKKLQFFGDVSDRVEKEEDQAPVVQRLETNAKAVVGGNWRNHICSALAEDLRKFRTYKGHSVRDLLRAMRNKKHHYRELPKEVRDSLGDIPEHFVQYFTSRYPLLLLHSYDALKWCSQEPVFWSYYSDHTRETMAPEIKRVEEERRQEKEERDTAEVWRRGMAVKKIETTMMTLVNQPTTINNDQSMNERMFDEEEISLTTMTTTKPTTSQVIEPPPGFEDVVPTEIKEEDHLHELILQQVSLEETVTNESQMIDDFQFGKARKKKKQRK
ncbi:unnamed protein product, partial [Mesorhabditis belari]|uniref:non-specific serine/threonine protein kinase n=1 Tax=Mesorhabditis belari TaxID=2138241 RepID=A0AAF3EZF9_9BILA